MLKSSETKKRFLRNAAGGNDWKMQKKQNHERATPVTPTSVKLEYQNARSTVSSVADKARRTSRVIVFTLTFR